MKLQIDNSEYSDSCVKICPIVHAINLIGQKWKIPILWHIAEHGTLHYNELKRIVAPITNTVLTRCLRELEESGLVNRFNHNTIPPSVEYSLTERGKSLQPALNELSRWGEEQIDSIISSI
jgi:DNA-binding HxlR family transcriptional regulator